MLTRRTCWSIRCVGVRARGPAFASICSMCRRQSGPRRSRAIPTMRLRLSGRVRPENLLELVRGRDLELIVAAVGRRLVGTPPLKDRGVAKAVALHVVVLHFAHALDSQRLPRQILARAPAALPTRHTR